MSPDKHPTHSSSDHASNPRLAETGTPGAEHFVHGRGLKPIVGTAPLSLSLREALRKAGVNTADREVFVFVGECAQALDEAVEIEDGADEHIPVDIDLTLKVLEVQVHRHVHVNECRHVAVDVTFAGARHERRFSPATTIDVVTRWARKKFRMDPAAAADFVIQVSETGAQPRSDEHLGELLDGSTCSIRLTLVKDVTHQG